jgi:hypothetical protein
MVAYPFPSAVTEALVECSTESVRRLYPISTPKDDTSVFRTLRTIHKISLEIERKATRLEELEMAKTTNVLGETYTKLERLFQSRELILEKAWEELRSIAEGLEQVIYELRNQLGTS